MPKSTKKTKAKKRSRKVRARPANYDDIQRALTKHVAEVLENIPLEPIPAVRGEPFNMST